VCVFRAASSGQLYYMPGMQGGCHGDSAEADMGSCCLRLTPMHGTGQMSQEVSHPGAGLVWDLCRAHCTGTMIQGSAVRCSVAVQCDAGRQHRTSLVD
jgi:hypothetical protein